MDTQTPFETIAELAVSLLHRKGNLKIYTNPNLTETKEKSIAFEIYCGPVQYCVEIGNGDENENNEITFSVDGETVLADDWFTSLNKEENI